MAYHWTETTDAQGHKLAVLHLHPNRPLTTRGFAWFFGITACLAALPLMAVLGSPILWMLLPFVVATIAGTWIAIRRHAQGPQPHEVLTLARDKVHLHHQPSKGAALVWEGNPYWLRLELHAEGGPVPDYLTLTAMGRKVELGAFLAPSERQALKGEIESRLSALR